MPDNKKKTAAHGLRLRITAKHLAETGGALGARHERQEADEAARRAEEILKLPEKPKVGTGGELYPCPEDAAEMPGLALTVEDPDAVTAKASRK